MNLSTSGKKSKSLFLFDSSLGFSSLLSGFNFPERAS